MKLKIYIYIYETENIFSTDVICPPKFAFGTRHHLTMFFFSFQM